MYRVAPALHSFQLRVCPTWPWVCHVIVTLLSLIDLAPEFQISIGTRLRVASYCRRRHDREY